MSLFKRMRLFILLHQRNYREILQRTSYYDSESPVNAFQKKELHYQALASFRTGNSYHARKSLISLRNHEAITADECSILAYIHARHNEKEEAITAWCTGLEIEPNHKLSLEALDYIRTRGKSLNLSEDEHFDSLLPPEPAFIPFKKIITVSLVIIIGSLLAWGGYFGGRAIITRIRNEQLHSVDEISNINFPDFNPNIISEPKDNEKQYSFTEEEIKKLFEKAKTEVIANHSVDAQITINTLLLSNAAEPVKFRVKMLADFIEEPDYGSFVNKISFNDFMKEPALYDHVYVFWEGRVANRFINSERIQFDLIIGDEERGIIEGAIPVVFTKAVIVENTGRVRVFGRLDMENETVFIDGRYLLRLHE